MKSPSPSQIAGLLSLLSAILVLAIWYILLFVAQPTGIPAQQSAFDTAHYLLFENDTSSQFFVWLAVVPFISIAIGVSYLFGAARTKMTALLLVAATAALGGSSLFLLNGTLAFFMALPAYWGYICVRQA